MDTMVTKLEERHTELLAQRARLLSEMRAADEAQARRAATVQQASGAIAEVERMLAAIAAEPVTPGDGQGEGQHG